MYVSDAVKRNFHDRKIACTKIIAESGVPYTRVGIFGSYARNDYKATSDIDFCIIVTQMPSRKQKGMLREDLEMQKADVCFLTEDYFANDNSLFAENLRRDFVQIL